MLLLAPAVDQSKCALAHLDCHQYSVMGALLDRDRIVEEYHETVARELLDRPAMAIYEGPHLPMIFLKNLHDGLRLGPCRKFGPPSQVAEDDSDHRAILPPYFRIFVI